MHPSKGRIGVGGLSTGLSGPKPGALAWLSMSPQTSWTLTLAGWVLFTVSALFFVVSSLRNGGPVEMLASATFLLACLLFMIPAIDDRPDRN